MQGFGIWIVHGKEVSQIVTRHLSNNIAIQLTSL